MESIRGYDKWKTAAPDKPEAVNCQDCGEEMEDGETCKYQWCPGKFEGVAAEMANELIEARAEVKRLARMEKINRRDTEHLLELGQQYAALETAARAVVAEDSKPAALKSLGHVEGDPKYWSVDAWWAVMKQLAALLRID